MLLLMMMTLRSEVTMTSLNDRLALAVCQSCEDDPIPCPRVCNLCRRFASAAAHELAAYLEERFGYSETAELIRGSVPEVGA